MNTYTRFTDTTSSIQSYVYGWNGIIAASYLGYSDSSIQETAFMNSLGNITGTLPNMFIAIFLEASGGELYLAVGSEESSGVSSELGVYRISELVKSGNFSDFSKAVQITHDNPGNLARDGKGGLYYTVYGEEVNSAGELNERYIYHWNGSSSTQVYDSYTEGVYGITYDINNNILYAESGYSFVALVPDSTGRLSMYDNYNMNNAAVIGNSADSSSSSAGKSIISTRAYAEHEGIYAQ